MPKFLNNIDLNGNQLVSPVIHVSSQSTITNGPAGNATGTEGQIFYNSHANGKALFFRDNSGWRPVGDISGVTITTDSGSGSKASDVSGSADFSILGSGGVGVTNSGATITVTAVASEIDHDSLSNFASGEHFTQANITTVGTIGNGVWQGTAIATAYIANDAVTEDKLDNTLLAEIDANTAKATNATHDGEVTGSGTLTIADDKVDEANLKVSNGPTNNYVLSAQSGNTGGLTWVDSAASTQTLTNKTIAASQVTEISNITADEGAQLENIGTATISATQWGYLGAATGAITNTDVSVSSANLKTTLGDGFPGNAVDIGDSGDAVTVPGDLTVSGDLTVTGDTITVNTSSLTVKDPIIVIANNNAADVLDTGFYSQYVATVAETSATRFAGIVRDANEDSQSFIFFKNLTDEPGTTVNTAHATFAYADIRAAAGKFTTITGALTGNVTGNASGSSGTCTGNAATSTKISSITNTNIVQLAGSQTLTGTKTFNSFKGTAGATVTNILDADDMSGASATTLATSESIKAYVDAQTSGDSNTGGRQAFILNDSVDGVAVSNSNKTYTITHGMGSSRNYGVEVIRNSANSGDGETVYTDVTRPSDTTIVVVFAAAPTAGNFTALVCKY